MDDVFSSLIICYLCLSTTDKTGYGDTETPRCTLTWPSLKPDTSDPINKRLKKIDNPPLINHASLSPDMKYLIACTDNNLVCIWSRADL